MKRIPMVVSYWWLQVVCARLYLPMSFIQFYGENAEDLPKLPFWQDNPFIPCSRKIFVRPFGLFNSENLFGVSCTSSLGCHSRFSTATSQSNYGLILVIPSIRWTEKRQNNWPSEHVKQSKD
ncbi:hypothetical protein AHF37_05345 [Paragonimus kellicotti]|nr:hypothetical protein AHF37_05345 [Paragonimus kellicotti]